jgi:hypothetical protein
MPPALLGLDSTGNFLREMRFVGVFSSALSIGLAEKDYESGILPPEGTLSVLTPLKS